MNIKFLDSKSADFSVNLKALLAFETAQDSITDDIVAKILHDVQTRGDPALLAATAKFDRWTPASASDL